MFSHVPYKEYYLEKKKGAFKLDTTVKINEENYIKKITLKIQKTTTINEIKNYVLSIIK